MWAIIQSNQKHHFALIEDRHTLGSAASNQIPIPSEKLKPMHSQFYLLGEHWEMQNFSDGSRIRISSGEHVRWGDLRIEFSEPRFFFRKYQGLIQDLFRAVLKLGSIDSFEDALREFERVHFFGRCSSAEIQSLLESQFHEYRREGPIERLLRCEDITDILVEDFDAIWIEEAGRLQLSAEKFTSRMNYQIYLENLLAHRGLLLSEAEPSLDFLLPSGARGHMIGSPLTPESRIYLSIRKPRETLLSLTDLLKNGFLTESLFRVINDSLRARLNILISGATGAGKTTLLKALLSAVSPNERMVVIEDTPELLSARPNTAFLKTRVQSRGDLKEISLRELVRQSLRMRPDRIIVGEVRGSEALDLLHAMNTGHRGSMGSLHANSCRDAVLRFQSLIRLADQALSETVTRELMASNLQLLLHCDRVREKRRVSEAAFIRGLDGNQILLEALCVGI